MKHWKCISSSWSKHSGRWRESVSSPSQICPGRPQAPRLLEVRASTRSRRAWFTVQPVWKAECPGNSSFTCNTKINSSLHSNPFYRYYAVERLLVVAARQLPLLRRFPLRPRLGHSPITPSIFVVFSCVAAVGHIDPRVASKARYMLMPCQR